ncbi:MAG TPA: CoA-binding protein [Acidobacteriaceae bacterium]|nr:CoA-binding protein [Acidobacteriaceae bacterium]
MNDPSLIRKILDECKTIAVVGLTNREGRASLGVARFMQSRGYRIVPVNPLIDSALGETAYPSLTQAVAAVPEICVVNVFRAPEHIPAIVDEVIRLHIPYLWLQEGVVHQEAALRAEAAGVGVIMNRCILKARMAAGWQ